MYFVKTPWILKVVYPSLVWSVPSSSPDIFLTFDDGPDATVTPEVLRLLKQYNAKATFFCVGEKVKRNPEIYEEILKNQHVAGNHTYNHLNGKISKSEDYFQNVDMARQQIDSNIFRPPYGRITSDQIKRLKKDYKIIMWDVLPGDFDRKIDGEQVLSRTIKHTKKGSIVVFHDNLKFRGKMMFALKGTLEHFSKKGYNFESLEKLIN